MDEISPKQREVLEFIGESLAENGMMPTIREIGDEFGIRSTNGVNDHLVALTKKGFITRDRMKARSLKLTPLGRVLCGMKPAPPKPPPHSLVHEANLALRALDAAAPALGELGHSAEGPCRNAAAELRKAGVR